MAKRFFRKVHPTSRSCEVRGRVHRANNAMTLLFLLCIHCPVIDTNLTAAAPLHLEVVAPRIKRDFSLNIPPRLRTPVGRIAPLALIPPIVIAPLYVSISNQNRHVCGDTVIISAVGCQWQGVASWHGDSADGRKVGVRAERIVAGRCADASDVLSSLEAVRAAAK